MRILISGITGYLGVHLSQALLDAGHVVHGLVRAPSPRVPVGVVTHLIPETDAEFAQLAAQVSPEVVFHLAGAYFSEAETMANLMANFVLGCRLVSALNAAGPCRFVNTASYWEFGSNGRANSNYAALKAAFRHWLSARPVAANFAHQSIVLFDVYGPADWRGKLLPWLTQNLGSAAELPMTEGRQLLDLVYIADVCRGLEMAATTGFVPGGLFTLASGQRHSLREVVATLERVAGKRLNVQWGAKAYPAHQLMNPGAPAPNLPGWRAEVPLEEGLRRCLRA